MIKLNISGCCFYLLITEQVSALKDTLRSLRDAIFNAKKLNISMKSIITACQKAGIKQKTIKEERQKLHEKKSTTTKKENQALRSVLF